MTLTKTDLQQIRDIVIEGFEVMAVPRFDALEEKISRMDRRLEEVGEDVAYLKSEVNILKKRFDELDGRVTALENDVKEIYKLLTQTETLTEEERRLQNLTLEKKILLTHKSCLHLAKEAGITLPRM